MAGVEVDRAGNFRVGSGWQQFGAGRVGLATFLNGLDGLLSGNQRFFRDIFGLWLVLRPMIPRVRSGRAGYFFGPYGPRAGRADGLWPDPPLH